MKGKQSITLPPFTPDGLLPPGDYELSFDQLRSSQLVLGPKDKASSPNWDGEWRGRLLDNLEALTKQLWSVGVREVFADGSFAEDKAHPNVIDGYFECDFDSLKSGIRDRHGHQLEFPSAFRQSRRDGSPRGIVKIRYGGS